MFYQKACQLFKHTLSFARIKLLYTRITLTRFTVFYFLLSLTACIGLVSLQGLTLTDNTQAIKLLGTVFENSQNITGLPIVTDAVLRICSDIPDRSANCTAMASFGGMTALTEDTVLNLRRRELVDTNFLFPRHGTLQGQEAEGAIKDNLSLGLTDGCVASHKWLDDVLHDAQREDVVTLFFQIWLLILSVITIVQESIPHLGAAFFGHVLGTAWSSYRLRSTVVMMQLYRTQIVPGACGGIDLVGNWWEIRISHAVPIVVFNVLALLGQGYASYELFNVYANQSFCRVGASERVYRIYKIVLLFSVCMQLSGFFSIASTAMWIDKVCHGLLHKLAKHSDLYLAAFITTLVLHVPWLYFGWICVRRECRIRFGVFCAISAFLTTISTLVFFSHLYRYIFSTWPFFATVTVTAYCLVIASTILGVVCQFNFGQGLAHYLLVTEALEGVDFTPVNFPKKGNNSIIDVEKSGDATLSQHKTSSSFDSTINTPAFPVTAWQPTYIGGGKKQRGVSVYSEKNGSPIILSSSPPLVSELGPAPSRNFFTKGNRYSVYSKRSTRRDTGRGFGGDVQMIAEEEVGAAEQNKKKPVMMMTEKPLPLIKAHISVDTNVPAMRTTSTPVFDSPETGSAYSVRSGWGSTQMRSGGSSPSRPRAESGVGLLSNPKTGSPTRRILAGAGLPSSPKARLGPF
ncbi:hypothetical protein CVT24_008249 [Panaeolus cyanescens]|uniref:Uncharacterized protein n=1 Tax=Panaeolus cyanescens TaxID=181874 RepID=A0A409VF84_9AGAR|nr:hypothetical protein CVT24_008249 [Panaeolus cyanescens]